eukprot:GEZU01016491.1.p1 GENE.GEZU01016491.1~~GEZU01016491.1.p1  ORF type:complete len:472 (+),score=119.74 GEZU01016491.1:155-1417(+)
MEGIATPEYNTSSVYAIVDSDNDYVADKIYTLVSGLTVPNGVAFYDGNLYIAQRDNLTVLRDIENNLENPPKPELLVTFIDSSKILPDPNWHGWRYIRISPYAPSEKPQLFLAIGSPCNTPLSPPNGTCSCELRFDNASCQASPDCLACLAGDAPGPIQNLGQIVSLDPRDGSNIQMYAQGVRNSLGFDWDPVTHDLWFTDNGRDSWDPGHNDRPPDELNHAPSSGLHFGFPFCFGKDLVDSEFNSKGNCDGYVGAAQELGPHVAALGMRFYTGKMFPAKYHNGIFIAEHGSWDRYPPIGYRVTFVQMDPKSRQPLSYTPFATGWLNETGPLLPDGEGDSWGRLADVEVLPDGSLLVSNEKRGEIYRISYSEPAKHKAIRIVEIILGVLAGLFGVGIIVAIVLVVVRYMKRTKYTVLGAK